MSARAWFVDGPSVCGDVIGLGYLPTDVRKNYKLSHSRNPYPHQHTKVHVPKVRYSTLRYPVRVRDPKVAPPNEHPSVN